MWLYIALLGYGALAVVNILDKFILSKEKVQPSLYTFYTAITVLPIVLLIPFGITMLGSSGEWLIAALSGVSFMLALIALYVGFRESEISHVGPLVGAAIPIFTLFLAKFFLHESISTRETIAVLVLIAGSVLISSEKSRWHSGWHKGMLWGIVAGLLLAISHVASKYIYGVAGFYSGFIWTRAALGLSGMFLLLLPSVHEPLFQKRSWFSGSYARGNLGLVVLNKLLAVAGVILIQYAISLGRVSLVSALSGVQFAFLVIVVVILSKFFPRLFREDYRRGEVIQELAAVVFISVGLVLLL